MRIDDCIGNNADQREQYRVNWQRSLVRESVLRPGGISGTPLLCHIGGRGVRVPSLPLAFQSEAKSERWNAILVDFAPKLILLPISKIDQHPHIKRRCRWDSKTEEHLSALFKA